MTDLSPAAIERLEVEEIRDSLRDDPSISPTVKRAMEQFWRKLDWLDMQQRVAIETQEAECERLRKLAHDAPLNPYREDHDGHRWVALYSTAWADRTREWIAACRKLEAMRDAK